jgi:hypothetical protein
MAIDWEQFNPKKYVEANYASIHDEDKNILDLLVNFYQEIPTISKALEIGVGPNLYPLMVMAPYVDAIDCVEYSQRNIDYLKKQLNNPDENWIMFHEYLIAKIAIYNFPLKQKLSSLITIHRGSIYDLPQNKYGLASMHFVAESITDKALEFNQACQKFIKSVEKGGYLVACFMENSESYDINGVTFPSYPVTSQILEDVFSSSTNTLEIKHIKMAEVPLRPGYTGMLFLTARR